MDKNQVMIILKPEFQKEMFQRVINFYQDSVKASSILKIPASSIRGYKNLYFNCVPECLINKLIKLRIIKSNEIERNIISTFKKNDKIKEILNYGREKRIKNINNIKMSIPSLKDLIHNNYIGFNKWFIKYQLLLNSGFRKIEVKNKKDKIIVKYNNFTKYGFRDFELKFQKRIILNDEFIYFFGLWCGDRAGGKRFGVCNQNKDIIKFTENFLKKYSNKIEKILYITKGMNVPKLKYDKKYIINQDIKGWVISVHCNNGIMKSFFDYLRLYLEDFLNIVKKHELFFAGLFDAEGNVSLYNKSFRWACKDDKLIEIYTNFLKKLNLYDRYDTNCLVSYNKEEFYKKIFPHLKHTEKINKTLFLCKGKGNLSIEYLEVLSYINKYPKRTYKQIAKVLKKNKIYSEVKLLSDFGFLSHEGYPYRFRITSKGLNSLGESKL
jgi:hypothetical protein